MLIGGVQSKIIMRSGPVHKFLITSLLSVGLMAPTITVQAQKIELIVSQNTALKRARSALQKGRFVKAIRLYERVLKKGASSDGLLWAYNDLCVAHYLQTELDKALGYCNKAIKLAPNKWISYNTRGNILVSSGFYTEATVSYKKALKLYPSSDIISKNLDLALAQEAKTLVEVSPPPLENKKNKNDPFIRKATNAGSD